MIYRSIVSIMIAAVLSSILLIGASYAQTEDRFYFNSYGFWSVLGFKETSEKNAVCGIVTRWDNKSSFILAQDLNDGELYAEMSWKGENFFPNLEENTLKMHFITNDGKDIFKTMKYKMQGNQSIVIANLIPSIFLPLFMEYDKVRLIPDNSDQIIEVSLKDSRNAINLLSECVKAAPKSQEGSKKPEING